jgi:hypothetical protein
MQARAKLLALLDECAVELHKALAHQQRARGSRSVASAWNSRALETRKALLCHVADDITTHYSAAEIQELIDAAERVCKSQVNTPTLTLLRVAGAVARAKPWGRLRIG